MPAWQIVLGNTLGSRQGTLYKAPRNAEVKLQDDNVFCKSDYWNLNACKASAPMPLSHQVYITTLISFFWGEVKQSLLPSKTKLHKVIMWRQKVVPSSVMSKDVHWRNLVLSLVDMLFFKNKAFLPGNFEQKFQVSHKSIFRAWWFRHRRIKKKQRNGSDLPPLSGQFWKHAWAGSAASSLNAASSTTSPCMMETWKRSGLENCLLMFIVFYCKCNQHFD